MSVLSPNCYNDITTRAIPQMLHRALSFQESQPLDDCSIKMLFCYQCLSHKHNVQGLPTLRWMNDWSFQMMVLSYVRPYLHFR